MKQKPTHRLRPAIDALEARDVPAGWWQSAWWWFAAAHPTPAPAPAPAHVSTPAPAVAKTTLTSARNVAAATVPASPVGDQVAAFAAAHLGQRVGGGECAHLAVEALRASGARFAWLTSATTDYAWGTLLTRVTGGANGAAFSTPSATFRPGDIIQYANARFADGTFAGHHTAIVAAVDGAGRVTAVYQQNFNGVRAVTEQPLDLTKLTAGHVKVYRPQVRKPGSGHFQFTVVNNAGGGVGVVERAGTGVASYSLSRGNTLPSYQVRNWATFGGVSPVITVAGQSIKVTDGAAYEIYSTPTGLGIRQL